MDTTPASTANRENPPPASGRRIIFRVTADEERALHAEAARRGASISRVIRYALAQIIPDFRRY